MKFNNLGIGVICLSATAFSQDKFNIAESINKFSVNLLSEVTNEGGDNLNAALSPLTIWTILTVISEGAFGVTASQLNRALEQPPEEKNVREYYKKLNTLFHQKTSPGTEFETTTGIFTRSEFPVKDKFANNAKQYYGANITPVDFQSNSEQAADIINKYVAKATRNRIPVLVNAADVENAYIMVTSTLYFKGQWEMPFNVSATERRVFFDDSKHEIGYVQMMHQARPLPYARMDNLKADALELPYGNDDSFSMLLLVPRGAQTLSKMLYALKNVSVTDILAKTKANHLKFPEDDIHVYLPKFKVTSDFNMDRPLERMGIVDVFDPQKANLLGIFPHYLYLSRVIQKAEIEVDEVGTVASAAAGAIFVNRAPPPTVTANRPFAFFIIDKRIGSIVFAGKISNPNTLRQ